MISNTASQPFWKEPWMWLVLCLPGAVVIAGFATLWIAMSNPETIVSEPHHKVGFTVTAKTASTTEKTGLVQPTCGQGLKTGCVQN
ncbi:MAG TPA: FixH family protein [Limnobacter sp.]|uniref:FixH family protein n=1 Tax=Limnobacter sp. TaxID=2003368 RepID=UPI002ED9BF56